MKFKQNINPSLHIEIVLNNFLKTAEIPYYGIKEYFNANLNPTQPLREQSLTVTNNSLTFPPTKPHKTLFSSIQNLFCC